MHIERQAERDGGKFWRQGGQARMLAIVAVVIAALAVFLAIGYSPRDEQDATTAGVRFEVVDGAHRELDGSPALALSFSLPLDSKRNYDSFVQVLEMPAAAKASTARGDGSVDDATDAQDAQNEFNSAQTSSSTSAKDTELEGGKPVAGAWVVGENPHLLFFPHIKPQVRYVVRIQPGLMADNGSKIEQEARFSILSAAVPPAFYFTSRGMVLPAAQNGGLPVTTVNVPEVDIQFLKVKPEKLAQFLEKVVARGTTSSDKPSGSDDVDDDDGGGDTYYYDRGTRLKGAVSYWDLDQLHKLTSSAFVGRFLTEQQADRRRVTFIPVESIPALREPGVYVAVMSQPNRFRGDYQTTYFYVSDLGLHLRQYASGADAYISSLTDGKARAGVEVSWVDQQGKTLARAESDSDGRVSFAEKPAGARVLMARDGEQMSLITLREAALDLAEFDIAGMPYVPLRLFAYSGRNLYRPGEHFDVSVMARDADGHPVPPQPIQAILRRPDGKAQWTATWQPDPAFAGYYQRAVELPIDAATGSWQLELRADPAARMASTSMAFAVEEFLPERMKLELSTASERLSKTSATWPIDVSGHYLYGAAAAGNQLVGAVTSERNRNPLAQKLPGFVFGDANEESVRSRSELPATTLDDQGQAAVDVDLEAVVERRSPFTVRATLSLLESGGRPVIRSIERVFWPAPVLVGLRPMFVGAYARENAPAEFEVVRANAEAVLQAGTALPVRLFREDRQYYWRFDDQRGWHSGFSEGNELIATTQVSVPAGGRGRLSLPVKYGRYRVEVFDPETGQTTRFRFYAGWSAKDDETQGVRPDRVALKLDKPAYKAGDTARLTITPPHAGEALITVEGERGLWARRLTIGADGGTIAIPIDEAWQRHDLYIAVMVLRPGGKDEKVTPARALGLVHLPLDRGSRKLTVNLEAAAKMEPEQPLKVKISVPEAKGQKTLLTLSAVDVGILNITRFASPDPFAFFFAKLRYGADAYDIYGRVIEKMAGDRGKLKFGGDAGPQPTRSLPKKIRLVDLFSGPVMLDENGQAEVSLPVPDFNGSLRLMAVAASGERFGWQEAEVTVAAPLIVELATPRFLSVGDRAVLALDVQNLAGSAQQISLAVSNSDGLLIQDGEQQFWLQDQQKRTLRIPVETGSALGLTELQVRVDSQRVTINRRFPLQVQAPTPRQSVLERLSIAPGESVEVRDAELRGFLRDSVAATLVVSNQTPIDVRNAVQDLLRYPYGCAEQTTSSAYPHVFIDQTAAQQFGLKPFTQAERAQMLDKAIARLAGMQAPNGAFSLWGNLSEYQYWLSAYISNFLIDAREQGFNVPPAVEKRALEFLLKGLQEGVAGLPTGAVTYNENSLWNDNRYAGSGRFAVLAYGAYVLARQGKAPLSTLRQLAESQAAAPSGLALVHLGLALKLMGDEARANEAIAAGLIKRRAGPLHAWWGDYGSNLRDWALIEVLLDKHQLTPAGRANLINQVAAEMVGRRYYSTQEKLALFLLGRSFATDTASDWHGEWLSAGKTQAIGGQGAQYLPLSAAQLAAGVTIRNTGDERLFAELNFAGNPLSMPAERRNDFTLQRDWFTAEGKPLGDRPLRVGETAIVRLRVQSAGRYANGLVVDYIPAGVEIENANLVQGEQSVLTIDGVDPRQAMQNSNIQHLEFRDDRFVVAARLAGTMQFFYRVRVVTPGRFVVPPTYAEDMYQPQIYGLAGGDETLLISDGREGHAASGK